MRKSVAHRSRHLAALVVLGMLGGGLATIAPVLAPTPTALPSAAAWDPSTVDPTDRGVLVIDKRLNPDVETDAPLAPGTGEKVDDPPGTRRDVSFEICPVLGYNDGSGTSWSFGSYTPADDEWWVLVEQAVSLFDPAEAGTYSDGAFYSGPWLIPTDPSTYCYVTSGGSSAYLPLGLYLVREKPDSVYLEQDPFLVTLPMPNSTGSDWLYWSAGDPCYDTKSLNGCTTKPPVYISWVYPKNYAKRVVKSVDLTNTVTQGDTMTFTIDAPIPCQLKDGNTCYLDSFELLDELSAWSGGLLGNQFTFDQDTLEVTYGHGSSFTVLTEDTGSGGDFELVWFGSHVTDNSPTNPVQSFKLVFTNAGLAKLATEARASNAAEVRVTYDAIVNDNVTTTDHYTIQDKGNYVHVNWNDSAVYSFGAWADFGGIMLHKVDEHGTPIAGEAQFQIFASETDANNLANPIEAVQGNPDGSGTVTDTFTTDPSDGTVAILDLLSSGSDETFWVGAPDSSHPGPRPCSFIESLPPYEWDEDEWGYQHVDCKPGDEKCDPAVGMDQWVVVNTIHHSDPQSLERAGNKYWVVETAAPAGYLGDSTPHEVCVVDVVDNVKYSPINGTDSTGDTYDDYEFVNVPNNAGFPLPYTGDGELSVPSIAGLAVIVLGFIGFTMWTKESSKAAAAAK